MNVTPGKSVVGGGFEVRMSAAGVPVLCAKSEPAWSEATALVPSVAAKGETMWWCTWE